MRYFALSPTEKFLPPRYHSLKTAVTHLKQPDSRKVLANFTCKTSLQFPFLA